jgi:predicted amidohydrolase YtcJ
VVLSEDILSVSEDQVREIKPVMTVAGGKIVFQQGS